MMQHKVDYNTYQQTLANLETAAYNNGHTFEREVPMDGGDYLVTRVNGIPNAWLIINPDRKYLINKRSIT
ncbi:hypothetical protein LCGC14_1392130 [marine sediment metagenome]|uniref:Uncharacterized protein n=1 Tax=marine sediment metagenome TaxID=412755 RepID=A0A0F9JZT7_9ZZZZ